MKLIQALLLVALLALAPIAAVASGPIADDVVIIDDFGDDGPMVPEPTSALLMMVGAATIVAVRRLRK